MDNGEKYHPDVTSATNFGVGGINNLWQPYKKGKSDCFLKVTLGLETLKF